MTASFSHAQGSARSAFFASKFFERAHGEWCDKSKVERARKLGAPWGGGSATGGAQGSARSAF